MTMNPKGFEWGGAVFTVSPATIGSYMQTSRIAAALIDMRPDADPLARYYYPRLAAQTFIDGDVEGWQQPHSGEADEAIANSFDEWLELPSELAVLWIDALLVADAPTAVEELQPDFEPDDADPKDKGE